jgi:hypothetical protein
MEVTQLRRKILTVEARDFDAGEAREALAYAAFGWFVEGFVPSSKSETFYRAARKLARVAHLNEAEVLETAFAEGRAILAESGIEAAR